MRALSMRARARVRGLWCVRLRCDHMLMMMMIRYAITIIERLRFAPIDPTKALPPVTAATTATTTALTTQHLHTDMMRYLLSIQLMTQNTKPPARAKLVPDTITCII